MAFPQGEAPSFTAGRMSRYSYTKSFVVELLGRTENERFLLFLG